MVCRNTPLEAASRTNSDGLWIRCAVCAFSSLADQACSTDLGRPSSPFSDPAACTLTNDLGSPTSKDGDHPAERMLPAREKPAHYCVCNVLRTAIVKLIDASKGGTDLAHKHVNQ